MKLSRDIQSLSSFKRDTSKFLKQMTKTGQPIILTVNGKTAAVVHDPESYQEYLPENEASGSYNRCPSRNRRYERWTGKRREEVFDDIKNRFGIGK